MTTGTQSLTMLKGETFEQSFRWLDPDRNPIDVSNYTAEFVILTSRSDLTPILTVTDDAGITLDDQGYIIVTISRAVVDELDEARRYYFLRVTSPGGVATKLVRGRLRIEEP
jgi:ribosome maturation factor RimP